MEFGITIAPISAPVWNRDDVKNAIATKLLDYTNVVYSEENIKAAKADRAELNKIAKAIEDERKRVKAVYNAPYLTFEAEVKEIVGMIDKTVGTIDKQVKAFEEKAKQEKQIAVHNLFLDRDFKGVPYAVIANSKWLLASTSLSAVEAEMDKIADEIAADMGVLETLDEYQFEAIQTYKATRSLTDAMRTVNTLKETAKEKAEYERQRALETAKEVPAETPQEEMPDFSKYDVKYTDDGMPDFDSMGGQHTMIVRTKVTDAEERKIRELLEQMAVEYTIIYGG